MAHERGYWTYTGETNGHLYDKLLCDTIINLIKSINGIKTVIDIGCGNGLYTKNFIENGFDCAGFDGSPLTPQITDNLCHIKDFSEYVDVGKFDLVLCLEVGEHIPEKYEQTFIDNVCRAAKDLIVLSWAIEGQGGLGHVNCRNNDYILNELSKRGFTYKTDDSNHLRKNSYYTYFKNTLMVFTKIK